MTLPVTLTVARVVRMISRRPLRWFALVWGVLQFALPMAMLIGDAQTALDSVGRPASHIEPTSSSSCRPQHSDACALCRFLSQSSAPVAKPVLDIPCSAGHSQAAAGRRVSPAPVEQRLPESRAPPIA